MTPTITPTVTPTLTPHLVPTPRLEVALCMAGDFLRAFGMDEKNIRIIQQGFAAGDLDSVTVKGLDSTGTTCASTTFTVDDLRHARSFDIDPASKLSVTAQISARFERAIIYCVEDMRRRGLRITYEYQLSQAGKLNAGATMARYGLVSCGPEKVHPNLRQVFTVSHAGVGAHLTHNSIYGT